MFELCVSEASRQTAHRLDDSSCVPDVRGAVLTGYEKCDEGKRAKKGGQAWV